MTALGGCELCQKQAQLQVSHVLPAFVFRWLKQAGHIRHAEEVNRRAQDGFKKEWLCKECETLLNSFETPFANKIFFPYDNDRNLKVRYGDWLLKFCVSISWRSLLYCRKEVGFSHFSENQIQCVDAALATWAKFLRGEYKHPGKFEQHLLPFTEIADVKGRPNLPPNINRYLTRAIQIDAASSESMCFIYSKLGPFAIFGFIDARHPSQWKGTKIEERGGWFGPRKFVLPSQLWDYITDRAARLIKVMEKISPTQQKKIENSVRANPEKFLSSGLFRAMEVAAVARAANKKACR